MQPVKTADCDVIYKAPPSVPECGDLYCHRVRPGVIRSTWEPNDQERELIAQGGRIQLTLAHEPIPPIMLEVMDKDVTEPVDEHPWRIDREPNVTPPREGGSNGSKDASAQTAEQAAQNSHDRSSQG